MARPLPTNIKAVVQPDPSSTSLEMTTLPLPTPTGDEYLVRVAATAPCAGELMWEVNFPALFKNRQDRVPGTEGAGVIMQVPEGSDKFKPGDEVFYRTDAWLRGSLAYYTTVPGPNLALKPACLSWNEAAATPLSALTAWQGLFEHGPLDSNVLEDATKANPNSGLRVLVTGAGGAVGSWAVKFASAASATVVGVCSGSKAADVREYGAAEVVDYTKTSVDKWVAEDPAREVDLILDCVGKDLALLWSALKDGGTFLSVSGSPPDAKPADYTKNVKDAKWFLVTPSGSDLARIAALIDKRGFRPLIDSVVSMDKFQEAYDKVDKGRTTGKVVITVP